MLRKGVMYYTRAPLRVVSAPCTRRLTSTSSGGSNAYMYGLSPIIIIIVNRDVYYAFPGDTWTPPAIKFLHEYLEQTA